MAAAAPMQDGNGVAPAVSHSTQHATILGCPCVWEDDSRRRAELRCFFPFLLSLRRMENAAASEAFGEAGLRKLLHRFLLEPLDLRATAELGCAHNTHSSTEAASVHVVDPETGLPIFVEPLPIEPAENWKPVYAVSPDGAKIVGQHLETGRITVFDARTGVQLMDSPHRHVGQIRSCAIYGRKVLTISTMEGIYGHAQIFDLDTMERTMNIAQDGDFFALSPDGTRAVICGRKTTNQIRIYEVGGGQRQSKLVRTQNLRGAPGLTYRDHVVACGFDTTTGNVRAITYNNRPTGPNRRCVARVWNFDQTGSGSMCTATLDLEFSPLWSIKPNDDWSRGISHSHARSPAKVWDLVAGNCLAILALFPGTTVVGKGCMSSAVSASGRRAVTVDNSDPAGDATLRVWGTEGIYT